MKRMFLLLVSAALLSCVNGCGDKKPDPAPKSKANPSAEEKPHSHGAGPHGGALTDWGGGAYHVEFTVDHDQKEATVYILGGDEKTPAPIKTDKIKLVIDDPMTEMDLVAKPLEGEAEGTSSRFVGTHDTIGIVQEFAGTISGEVDSTPYTGDFKEEPAK
jgi:predicted small lipoprotein YifL